MKMRCAPAHGLPSISTVDLTSLPGGIHWDRDEERDVPAEIGAELLRTGHFVEVSDSEPSFIVDQDPGAEAPGQDDPGYIAPPERPAFTED
jgi:hypothetical protein